MKGELVRFMWVFCFFDLPVGTKSQRRAATKFRNHLKRDGFIMMQYSVYARLARGQDGVDKHIKRLQNVLPKTGSIRCLQVTDKQFGRMKLLLGNVDDSEEKAGEQLILL